MYSAYKLNKQGDNIQGRWLRGATPCPRSGAVAGGATPCPRSGGVAERSYSMSKERRLCRRRRAERSYSISKVRRGSREEITLIQGKEQWLRFVRAVMNRYSMPKVRETQVRW